ncbi:MAG: hypothetical protein LBD31_03530 [Treponema sp.]|jgi:heme/copper-type cytochrome/quinol oxidase subunit 2|nr:hypothetical protein [Treponema sp.]
MLVFSAAAALVPAVLIAYFALSKKTNPAVRKACAAALVLIGLAFAACAVLLIFMLGPAGVKSTGFEDIPPAPPAQEGRQDIITMLVIAAAVFLFVALIIILSIREQRRTGKKAPIRRHSAHPGGNHGQYH